MTVPFSRLNPQTGMRRWSRAQALLPHLPNVGDIVHSKHRIRWDLAEERQFVSNAALQWI
jgi:hypothetical protein